MGFDLFVTKATMPHDDPTIDRLEDQITWYDSRSNRNQQLFKPHMERGWSAQVQLEAMDEEGIDLAVLYPSRGLNALSIPDMEPEFAAVPGTVSVWCAPLGAGPWYARAEHVPHYAASTMKVAGSAVTLQPLEVLESGSSRIGNVSFRLRT